MVMDGEVPSFVHHKSHIKELRHHYSYSAFIWATSTKLGMAFLKGGTETILRPNMQIGLRAVTSLQVIFPSE